MFLLPRKNALVKQLRYSCLQAWAGEVNMIWAWLRIKFRGLFHNWWGHLQWAVTVRVCSSLSSKLSYITREIRAILQPFLIGCGLKSKRGGYGLMLNFKFWCETHEPPDLSAYQNRGASALRLRGNWVLRKMEVRRLQHWTHSAEIFPRCPVKSALWGWCIFDPTGRTRWDHIVTCVAPFECRRLRPLLGLVCNPLLSR